MRSYEAQGSGAELRHHARLSLPWRTKAPKHFVTRQSRYYRRLTEEVDKLIREANFKASPESPCEGDGRSAKLPITEITLFT